MQDKPCNVLFIGTGNSARSVIAGGSMSEIGKGRLIAFSTGSQRNR
ncbi:MAG: hypothetical protein JNL87_18175 [Burkholderiaceae bacterium]|nr:hypothetical protein [Burkholderiaceae bacterium]